MRSRFTGYPSSKPQYYRELWSNGPIATEAKRLARLEAIAIIRRKGHNPADYSEKAIEKLVTVLMFNSEAVFLQRAKFNVEFNLDG